MRRQLHLLTIATMIGAIALIVGCESEIKYGFDSVADVIGAWSGTMEDDGSDITLVFASNGTCQVSVPATIGTLTGRYWLDDSEYSTEASRGVLLGNLSSSYNLNFAPKLLFLN